MPRFDHVRRIARTEVRRTVRGVGDNRTQLVAVAFTVAMFTVIAGIAGYALVQVGEAFRAGDVPDIPVADGVVGLVRGAVGLAFLGLVLMSAIRTVGKRATVDEPAGLLLASRVRDVVPAVVCSEFVLYLSWLLAPVLVVVVGFSYGAGAPGVVLALPAVVVGVGLPGIWLGYLVGLVAHHLVTRYPPLARNRGVLVAVAFVAYFGLIFTGTFGEAVSLLFDPVQASPLSWYGDLLLLGAPAVSPSLLRAGAAVTATLALLPVLQVATVRVASYHWFSDPAHDAETDEAESAAVGPDALTGDSVLSRVTDPLLRPLARPTRQVVRVAWLRTRRAPIKLLYLGYPLFAFLQQFATIVETGEVPAHMPFLLALYVAWGAAMAFTLNPLGDDGPVLPATLSSPLTGRQFVTGHVLAGVLPGLPVALVVVGASAAASPLSPDLAAAAVGTGLLGVVLAPVLAAGIGVSFPRFGSVKVAGNRKAVVPSKTAMLVFSLALGAVAYGAALAFVPVAREATVGILGLVVAVATPWELSLAAGTAQPVGYALVLAGAVAPLASFQYAVGQYDAYTVD
ncbi:hypothetical protein [Haloarchaeobius amylolyticus]|uniref:hypothetical protein n=1 Tax=Haloarchaeobius amylolyticus TaxID=1198296 RepID=UPI00226DD251|nr:hypothetical protein [Haloarchaeobius amylolyticus]